MHDVGSYPKAPGWIQTNQASTEVKVKLRVNHVCTLRSAIIETKKSSFSSSSSSILFIDI